MSSGQGTRIPEMAFSIIGKVVLWKVVLKGSPDCRLRSLSPGCIAQIASQRLHSPVAAPLPLGVARCRTERRYHDVLASDRVHFVVLGCETRGRWDDEALDLVKALARQKVL